MVNRNNISLLFLVNQLWRKINYKRKIKIGYLTIVILITSISEIISLSSVIPFIGFITNPEYFIQNDYFKYIPLNIDNYDKFGLVLFSSFLLIFSGFLSAFLKIYTQWEIKKFAADLGSDFSEDTLSKFLYKPYESILLIESSNVISTILADVNDLVNSVITPLLSLIAATLITGGIISALVVFDGFISLITILVIFIIYLISQKLSSNTFQSLGYKKVRLRTSLIKNLQESIGAIKDIILSNNQSFYGNIHKELDRPLRRVQARMAILPLIPKSVVEPFGISIIALTALFFAFNSKLNIVIPFLGALALGAQKLIPQVQMIYQSWSSLKGAKAILIKVISLLDSESQRLNAQSNIAPYRLKKNIKFEKVSFKYKNSNKNIISDLNLEIKKGERLGLVGKTGSGKSTLVDLIMGLLTPHKGSISIDGISINNKNSSLLFSWRLSIAHVPQNIFLINATIAENIAFGVPLSKIDLNRVKQAAKQACIDKFIRETKDGYFTKTGERGIMLSGGQLQRIGIARAIYKKAKILILDEATSALDEETEDKIIKSIEAFSSDIMIIFITHRYSLLRNCNRIIEMNNGRISKDKSYKDFFGK